MASKGSSFSEGENTAKFGPGSCHKAGMRLKLCLAREEQTICVAAKRIDTDAFMTRQVFAEREWRHSTLVLIHSLIQTKPHTNYHRNIALNYANQDMSRYLTWQEHRLTSFMYFKCRHGGSIRFFYLSKTSNTTLQKYDTTSEISGLKMLLKGALCNFF